MPHTNSYIIFQDQIHYPEEKKSGRKLNEINFFNLFFSKTHTYPRASLSQQQNRGYIKPSDPSRIPFALQLGDELLQIFVLDS